MSERLCANCDAPAAPITGTPVTGNGLYGGTYYYWKAGRMHELFHLCADHLSLAPEIRDQMAIDGELPGEEG